MTARAPAHRPRSVTVDPAPTLAADPAVEQALRVPSIPSVVARGGEPLDPDTRAAMGSRLGHDFARVRVHRDDAAAESARALGADAYTIGSHVVFGAGRYAPETADGTRLLAHELAHTIQQGESTPEPHALAAAGSAVERSAEQAADTVAAGGSYSGPLGTSAGGVVARQAAAATEIPAASEPVIAGTGAEQEDERALARRLRHLDPVTRAMILARIRGRRAAQRGEEGASPAEAREGERATAEEAAPEGQRQPAGSETRRAEAERAAAGSRAAGAGAAATAGVDVRAAHTATDRAQVPTEAAQARAMPDARAQATGATATRSAEDRTEVAERTEEVRADAAEGATGRGATRRTEAAQRGARDAAAMTEGEGADEEAEDSENPIAAMAAAAVAREEEAAPAGEPAMETAPGAEAEAEPAAAPTDEAAGTVAEEGFAGGEAAFAEDTYDAESARAEVAELARALLVSGRAAERRVRRGAESSRQLLGRRAEEVGARLASVHQGAVATTRAAFQAQRETARAAATRMNDTIDAQLSVRLSELDGERDTGVRGIEDVFTGYRDDVNDVVQNAIAGAEQVRIDERERLRTASDAAATTARNAGYAQRAQHPDTGRGRAQAQAAWGVATETAREIEEQQQESLGAIDELLEEPQESFRADGERALEGFDEGLPELREAMRSYATETAPLLRGTAEAAYANDNGIAAQVVEALTIGEAQAIERLGAIRARATEELQSGVSAGNAQIAAAERSALRRIRTHVRDAHDALLAEETPDVEAAREIVSQMEEFAGGAAEETAETMRTTARGIGTLFTRMATVAEESYRGAEEVFAGELREAERATDAGLAEVQQACEREWLATFDELRTAYTDTQADVRAQLQPGIDELRTGFDATLQQLRTEVAAKVGEAMTKYDEAIQELPGKMEEAADDAGWDYDHEILAWLRDAAALIAGIIVGILAIIALVVVVILAAKLIIAGLVAAGLSAAVATWIVVIAGLVALGYGLVTAYLNRRAQGQGYAQAIFGAIADNVGITDIARGISDENLSPFERGRAIGGGIATLATTIVPFARARGLTRVRGAIDRRIPAGLRSAFQGLRHGGRSLVRSMRQGAAQRFPRATARLRPVAERGRRVWQAIENPNQGVVGRWMRGQIQQRTGRGAGLELRGYRPQPSQRSMTRAEYRAQQRAERLQRPEGLASRGRRPAAGTRTTTREQYRARQRTERLQRREAVRSALEGPAANEPVPRGGPGAPGARGERGGQVIEFPTSEARARPGSARGGRDADVISIESRRAGPGRGAERAADEAAEAMPEVTQAVAQEPMRLAAGAERSGAGGIGGMAPESPVAATRVGPGGRGGNVTQLQPSRSAGTTSPRTTGGATRTDGGGGSRPPGGTRITRSNLEAHLRAELRRRGLDPDDFLTTENRARLRTIDDPAEAARRFLAQLDDELANLRMRGEMQELVADEAGVPTPRGPARRGYSAKYRSAAGEQLGHEGVEVLARRRRIRLREMGDDPLRPRGHGIDNVGDGPGGELVLFEAKGPHARIRTGRRGGRQGSPQWVADMMAEYARVNHPLAYEIRQAAVAGKLRVQIVRGSVGPNGRVVATPVGRTRAYTWDEIKPFWDQARLRLEPPPR